MHQKDFPECVQSKEIPIRGNLCRKYTDLWSEYSPPQEGPMDNIQLPPRGLAHATEEIFPPCKARSPRSRATCAGSILICGQSTPSPKGGRWNWLGNRYDCSQKGACPCTKGNFPACKTGRTNLGAGREVYWSVARVLPPHPKHV
jgi:hypothetical protein